MESTSGVLHRWAAAELRGSTGLAGGSPRPTPPPSLRRTSLMWWASPKHGSPSRWPPPGRITLMPTVHRVSAKQCWRNVFRGCCRRCRAAESLEVTAIHSVAGLLSWGHTVDTRPPAWRRTTTQRCGACRRGSGWLAQGGQQGASRGVVPGRVQARSALARWKHCRTPLRTVKSA